MAPQLAFVKHARSKLEAVLAEVNKLKHSDFPEETVRSSLLSLEDRLNRQISRIDSLPPSLVAGAGSETWAKACHSANRYVAHILPVLGFILRSTNVRNAFELYDPVLRLCRRIFGPRVSLLLSSEWEFSPFTYALGVSDLPDYVLIGLPVSEAGNGLIVPLVGHEIAHSVWRDLKFDQQIEAKVRTFVIAAIEKNAGEFTKVFDDFDPKTFSSELFFVNEIAFATTRSVRQCEEEFCDLVGCRIFGDSYLEAFQYLLSPCLGVRSPKYLDLPDRAKILANAAKTWGFTDRADYVSSFRPMPKRPGSPQEDLLDSVSDMATHDMLGTLTDIAVELCSKHDIPLPNEDVANQVLKDFEAGVPSDKADNFVDIVNAGWAAMRIESFWQDHPNLAKNKSGNLSQLIFKSMEVAEYNLRIQAVPAATE